MTVDRQAELDALFERLFSAYRRPILNYLHRLLGDRAQAEEVAQDVFVKAYRHIGRLPADANHRAWLYRVATNAATDQLRRRKLIGWVPLLDNDVAPSGGMGTEGTVIVRQDVRQALDALPLKYRAPLVLFTVEGYSTQEIAEMLGLSLSATKVRLHRARERFRLAYHEDAAPRGDDHHAM